MKYSAGIFFIVVALTQACSEPSTTIEIQNYDGPIYLHIPAQNEEECSPQPPSHNRPSIPNHPPMEIECTCVAKPSVKYIPINTASEHSCGNPCNTGTYYPGTFNGGSYSGYPGICGVGSCNTGSSNTGTVNTCTCTTCNTGTSYPGYPYYSGGSSGFSGRGMDKVFVTMDIANPNSYGGVDSNSNNCNCPKCNCSC